MKRVHYTDSYLLNPQHPVTVNLIGAGGTGSQVLTNLARLDVTLRALGHPGLFVTLYDPDIVTEANIGRQLFGYSERHSSTPHGRIPTNMLWSDTRKGYEKYIWYNPPQKRMMFFKESLHIENAEYNLPGVIYEVSDERMNIYAYIDKELKPETELYAAPFFNVTGSSVCLGSAKIDKPTEITYDKLLEYWEKKFWLTEFSHLGGNGNPTKSNLVLVTKAAKDAPFNIEELKPLKNLKLKDILR